MIVYIENDPYQYRKMFQARGWDTTDEPLEADLVCFTGGEDVSPSLYGEEEHHTTYSNRKRDDNNSVLYNECLTLGIPMVGICRGGQFLNVMNGGRMFQHVGGHTQDHLMYRADTGKSLLVSSTHHQMMRPGPDHHLLAYARQNRFKETMSPVYGIMQINEELDTEVVIYENTQSLCFQPHPEFPHDVYGEMTDYFFECVKLLMGEG